MSSQDEGGARSGPTAAIPEPAGSQNVSSRKTTTAAQALASGAPSRRERQQQCDVGGAGRAGDGDHGPQQVEDRVDGRRGQQRQSPPTACSGRGQRGRLQHDPQHRPAHAAATTRQRADGVAASRRPSRAPAGSRDVPRAVGAAAGSRRAPAGGRATAGQDERPRCRGRGATAGTRASGVSPAGQPALHQREDQRPDGDEHGRGDAAGDEPVDSPAPRAGQDPGPLEEPGGRARQPARPWSRSRRRRPWSAPKIRPRASRRSTVRAASRHRRAGQDRQRERATQPPPAADLDASGSADRPGQQGHSDEDGAAPVRRRAARRTPGGPNCGRSGSGRSSRRRISRAQRAEPATLRPDARPGRGREGQRGQAGQGGGHRIRARGRSTADVDDDARVQDAAPGRP